MTDQLKKSPLCDLITRHNNFDFEAHRLSEASANDDIWDGYSLPVEFSSAKDEYGAIRNTCGLFDGSPMSKIRFTGNDAGKLLDCLLTTPVSKLPSMRATYGLMCTEDGYLLDDGILLKFAEDNYLFLITEVDHSEHYARYNEFSDVTITNETHDYVGLALQGPKSCALLKEAGIADIESLKPFEIRMITIGGCDFILGRLGFTGDLGYELWFPPIGIEPLTHALNQAEQSLGLKPLGYGLHAVQIGRIEAGMIVPGWDTASTFTDLETERTPFELTLGWNVKLEREDNFVGKAALIEHKERGPRFRMKGFTIDKKCSIEDGQALYAMSEGEQVQIGTLPSTIWQVLEDRWIGFASVKAEYMNTENLFIMNNGTQVPCELCKLPFINLDRRNQTPAPL